MNVWWRGVSLGREHSDAYAASLDRKNRQNYLKRKDELLNTPVSPTISLAFFANLQMGGGALSAIIAF